ncbi:hypothetical protein Drorol1_Dr00026040 [Drosera rotundifolia]
MTRKNPIIIRSPTSSSSTHQYQRRQRLLSASAGSSSSQRFAAAAGETTAGCAAICCCCPCGIAKLLVLAVFKFPAEIYRKALKSHRRRRRRQILKNNGLSSSSLSSSESMNSKRLYDYDYEFDGYRIRCGAVKEEEQQQPRYFRQRQILSSSSEEEMGEMEEVFVVGREVARELMKVEKEMWDRFYSAGFWRSPSQREPNFTVAGRVDLVAVQR